MLDLSKFFPPELKIDKVIYTEKEINICVISIQTFSLCPLCENASGRVNCYYSRTLMDASILGKGAILNLVCRKFICLNKQCKRKIFTERFTRFIKSYARRTERIEEMLEAIAFSSNAETSSKLTKKLGCGISPDTVIRIIMKTNFTSNKSIEYIGVDDWAYKKNHEYGTLICDLITHKPIALLEGRDASTLEAWLEEYPCIKIISRDRSKSYASAVKNKCPEAESVADRFHLVQNLLEALKEFTKRVLPSRICIGYEQPIEPVLVEKNDKNINQKEQRKTEAQGKKILVVREVKLLHKNGMSLNAISKHMQLDYRTVMRYVRLDEERATTYIREPSPSKLDEYADIIKTHIIAGKKSSEIFLILQQENAYTGSSSNLRKYIKKLKNGEIIFNKNPQVLPKQTPKKIWIKRFDLIQSIWAYKDEIEEQKQNYLKEIYEQVPIIKKVHSLVQDYRIMFRDRLHENLESWIEDAIHSGIPEIKSLARGLLNDLTEVKNALIYPYNNGLLEGHVNRLKMLKRLMFGKAKLPLLEQRVLYQF